jgi:tRNA (guanine-N7-)-methyltransferase
MRTKPWARPELAVCSYFVKEPQEYKGKWKEWFPKKQPLQLELGCGKGTFMAELALKNPTVNYLAIDINSDVLGVARRNIESTFSKANRSVQNIALMSFDIERILLMMDENDAVERIYINFCNPWPKGKHHKKRLTHTRQLEKYKRILADGGEIFFKTDDEDLYLATLRYLETSGYEVIYQTTDLHALQSEMNTNNIMTEHEKMFAEQGIPIKALIARYHKKPQL